MAWETKAYTPPAHLDAEPPLYDDLSSAWAQLLAAEDLKNHLTGRVRDPVTPLSTDLLTFLSHNSHAYTASIRTAYVECCAALTLTQQSYIRPVLDALAMARTSHLTRQELWQSFTYLQHIGKEQRSGTGSARSLYAISLWIQDLTAAYTQKSERTSTGHYLPAVTLSEPLTLLSRAHHIAFLDAAICDGEACNYLEDGALVKKMFLDKEFCHCLLLAFRLFRDQHTSLPYTYKKECERLALKMLALPPLQRELLYAIGPSFDGSFDDALTTVRALAMEKS